MRQLAVIALLSLAIVVYLVMLGRTGILLVSSGDVAATGLGIGVLLLPVVGAWALVATLRAGVTHQRLAAHARAAGMELDVSALPRRASGRIQRAAADELFATVRAEVQAEPDNWMQWYRLARAYDYAGDRGRARETMKKAVALQERSASD